MMPTMEQIQEGYFNYLGDVIFKALHDADRYHGKDFEIVRVELMMNLRKILQSHEDFIRVIDILKADEMAQKYNKILSLYKK